MSIRCRSCLTKSQKEYFSILTVFPEFGKKSILDLLNFITSSEITYSENLPHEVCMNCFKQIKSAYSFIILFNNSQEFLQKKSQQCSDKGIYIKIDNLKFEESVVSNNEKELEQILDSDNTERIVIVNDDGSTYEDMVQEIFGIEETKFKKENIGRQINEIQNIETNIVDKTKHKFTTASADDILGQKENLKLIKYLHKQNDENVDVFHQEQQDEVSFNEKDEVFLNKDDEIFLDEVNEISYIDDENCSNEDTIFYEDREDNMHPVKDIEEDEDIQLEMLEIKSNLDRKINNIQIVTIDDVLSNEKRRKDENKRILSVEDVLKIKPRAKRCKAENDMEIFSCDICSKIFDRRRKLTLHKLRNHNPNWREKFKCQICGLQCKTLSAHRHHLAKHEDKRHHCNQCEKTYMTKAKMKEHILRVHEKKMDNKYLCTECGKGFKFSNALVYHMNKHTNSRNFICRYCGFASMALSALTRHERVHTGERPYTCKYCKKTFAGAAEKQKHEFGHEGVFRYQCKYCTKKFIQTYNMKVHWMQHKGPYYCEVCQRNFADAEILKFHYAHSHKIKDVIIEDAEVKSEDELLTDNDKDENNG